MRLTVLASGSGGNSILVEAAGARILVDAGLPPRELAKRLDRTVTGTRLDDVQAVVCTHEHTDHASGVAALASAGLAVHCTAGTARACNLTGTRQIIAGESSMIGGLRIVPVALPHDAVEPVGLIFVDEGGSAGILTDCGHPTPEVALAFAACDVLVLETNYDTAMLRGGTYPPAVKRRIGGQFGHLSNEESAALLRLMHRPRAQVLVLAHLSALNNRPRLARSVVQKTLVDLGVRPRILVARQEGPLAPITCERGLANILPDSDNRQLSLAFPDWA